MGNNNNNNTEGDTIFQTIIDSNKWLSEHSKDVKINKEAIESFITDLDREQYESKTAIVNFPLNFGGKIQDEINFWFILNMINFGSGYRKELHDICDRGAYDTICYGMIGMHLGQGGKLNAQYLSKLSINEISSLFGIPVSEEVQQSVGIYTYRDSPMKPLAASIHKVLKESAEVMLELGYPDFGAFILKELDTYQKQPEKKASLLVSKIISALPMAFNDQALYTDTKEENVQSRTIYFYKKAQILVADLYRLFKDRDARFNFVDIDEMTVFTDNVLPAVLRKLDILKLEPQFAEHIDKAIELEPGLQEIELRGLAIYAAYLIVQRAKELDTNHFITNQVKLDYYLWTIGKLPDFRSVERHYTKKTIFY